MLSAAAILQKENIGTGSVALKALHTYTSHFTLHLTSLHTSFLATTQKQLTLHSSKQNQNKQKTMIIITKEKSHFTLHTSHQQNTSAASSL